MFFFGHGVVCSEG